MLKSLDIFLWDMKVGTIISAKKKYTEEIDSGLRRGSLL